MNDRVVIECAVHFRHGGRGGRKQLREGPEAPPAVPVPRLARLMALAIRFERLVRSGEVRNYAELARLGRVSRARVTQIMNLLQLAPEIQETLLFLVPPARGRDAIRLRDLQPIALTVDWVKQRRLWRDLGKRRGTKEHEAPQGASR